MTFLNILTIVIIGLSLSIDAFSLSLAYGLVNIKKSHIIRTSLLVGLFHFIMPVLGNQIGRILTNKLNINSKYILLVVLSLILIEMIKSLNEKDKEYDLSITKTLLFAFLVSVDSFSLGLGINYITGKVILASMIFSIQSFIFTLLGFNFGKYLSEKEKNISKKVGITLLFTVIIYFLCKG